MNNKKSWISEQRKEKAVKHTEYVGKIFKDDIKYSVENSKVYYDLVKTKETEKTVNTNIILDDITTDAAVQKYGKDNNLCILNFASFKYPGGGFIIGAIAQEEAICHASNLYNVIGDTKFEQYYINNRNNTYGGLYKNFGIFSPDVVFTDEQYNNVVKVDVITVPAPNLSAYDGSKDIAYKTLKSRIKFLLNIAKANNVENLVLGAFGCGVFKNDPETVAFIFKDFLETEYNFKNVYFAIPAGVNYDAFKKIFNI